ncbi:MAG: FAD-binding oxidoreductase [Gemmatimonadales bacterium]|jgi:FAD/FMN-containing dehydrogenase
MADDRSLVARGLGRSYGDAAYNSAGHTVLTERLNRFVRFDADSRVLDCEAGVTVDEILMCFVPRGFFLPVVPGTKFVTMGGALACDVHGKNHHKDGSLSRHVTDFRLLTPSGDLVVCSREENTDLFWATVGGLGLTGIVTDLRIKLIPLESAHVSVDYDRADNVDEALELFHESDEHYKYSVAWLDGMATGRSLGRSVLMRGNPAAAGPATDLGGRSGRSIAVPDVFPGFLLNRLSVRAFNTLYYRRHPRQAREVLTHYEPFFFPLDRLSNWNRLYGKRGLLQYQFVVPYDGGREALIKVLELFAKSKHGMFLAVLKRFGPGEAASALSFPMPGYTLAADIPRRGAGTFDLLRAVDRVVTAAGGRIYLAKDARLAAGAVREMYDRLNAWLELKARIDPDRHLTSDLAERLELVP